MAVRTKVKGVCIVPPPSPPTSPHFELCVFYPRCAPGLDRRVVFELYLPGLLGGGVVHIKPLQKWHMLCLSSQVEHNGVC